MTHVRRDERDRLDPTLLRLIGVVLLGGIMGILDSTMVAVAAKTLAGEFNTSVASVSWATSGYLLALTVTIPITSWAVVRFGSRRLWLFGLMFFLAASLACALAWSVQSLVVFRVLQGSAAGILDPLVLVLLARAAGPGRVGRVMGLMGVVLSLGPVLGPVLGGQVLELLDWRWMFLINLPIGVLAFVLAQRVLPAVAPPHQDHTKIGLDVLGLALLAPGFAALMLALSQAERHGGFDSQAVLLCLALGVLLLAAYVAHALRVRDAPPLIDVTLFANRAFAASVTVQGLVGLATYGTLFALPLFFQQFHGYGVGAAGLLVAPLGVGAAVAMPLAGRLSDQLGAKALARGGAVVAACGAFSLAWIGTGTSAAWPAASTAVIGCGLGFVGAPTMGSLYRTLPPARVPQGSSVLYNLNQLGAALGVALVALLLATVGARDPLGGLQAVGWFLTAVTLVILAATALLPGRPQELTSASRVLS